MAECIEFEGKTVQAAVQKACESFHLSTVKLKYEVISHGSSGIFGLVGMRNARIRVNMPPRKEASQTTEVPQSVANAPAASEKPVACRATGEAGDTDWGMDAAELGRELIGRIVGSMTNDATVSVVKDDGRLRFDVNGGNHGVIIGKRGQTLEAIHYLVEKIINKQSDKRIRVHLDVGGYLENRRQELRQLAVRMAKKACKNGKPTTVGQMNAHDRRIIHLALKDDVAVRTQSVGQGHVRKLMIFPRRPPGKRRDDSDRNLPEEIGAE